MLERSLEKLLTKFALALKHLLDVAKIPPNCKKPFISDLIRNGTSNLIREAEMDIYGDPVKRAIGEAARRVHTTLDEVVVPDFVLLPDFTWFTYVFNKKKEKVKSTRAGLAVVGLTTLHLLMQFFLVSCNWKIVETDVTAKLTTEKWKAHTFATVMEKFMKSFLHMVAMTNGETDTHKRTASKIFLTALTKVKLFLTSDLKIELEESGDINAIRTDGELSLAVQFNIASEEVQIENECDIESVKVVKKSWLPERRLQLDHLCEDGPEQARECVRLMNQWMDNDGRDFVRLSCAVHVWQTHAKYLLKNFTVRNLKISMRLRKTLRL